MRAIPEPVREFSPPGRPDLRFVNAESLPLQWIYWMGLDEVGRPGAGAPLWEHLCAHSHNIAEVGANIGFYTVPGSLVAPGSYTAFEPHPASAAALRANLAANRSEGVDVVEAAVVPNGWGDRAQLRVPTGHGGATPAGASLSWGDTSIEVAAVPVDAALGECDLLKVDVEGFEAELLRASWAKLEQLRPVVMVEVLDLNQPLRALLPELASNLDASLYAMGRATLVPAPVEVVSEGAPFQTFGTWDYLLVPSGRRERVRDLIVGST